MKGRLEPIPGGFETAVRERPQHGSFAILGRAEMIALAQAMPDSQSAILWCLAWHTALQERMRQGPLAGRRVARVSAKALAKITGWPIRTVRWAISKLKARGLIVTEAVGPGKTSVYQLWLDIAQPHEPTNDIDQSFDEVTEVSA